ncbi:glycerol-3-phosphate dehydrogenase [Candidatus Woesearchaeota archaeon]|jgi:glycerol-3-phosphate dehydrogenase (NAD(P)+)|nr:glycerol-3-phosphate dehydrogenase [Candidatus Woesearchaeota archaeon]|tara:strand:+ start:3646 stop:4635 length:990 start_codon:yes stop_codon:yes gene_type:complete
MNSIKKISVIGAGSWGTTLAILLADKGLDVKLWTRREELSREIESKRENKQYLPGIKFPDNLIADHSLKNALENSEMILSAVPSEFLRQTLKEVKNYFNDQIIVSATKGIEHPTSKRMSEVIADELGSKTKIAVLSGPNHAEEVSKKMPTASVAASKDKKTSKMVSDCLSTQSFKVYQLNDVAGVEICAALKNITAIATGVCDGLGFGDNARASIITLGLMEMNDFGKQFGAKRETVYGLAGVGDLIATCISKYSRNRFVGETLAKGKSMEELKKDMKGMIAEGIPTTKAVYEYSTKHNIRMPLTHQAYEVLYEKKDIKHAIKDLLNLI